MRSAEEGRAAVRDQVGHGADWIKLFPAGNYSFSQAGKDLYQVTYPLPVLQAMIDETHRLGRKRDAMSMAAKGNATRSWPAATPSNTALASIRNR